MKDIFSSIKSYFISIKDNFYLLAMLLLVTFFSSLNIANGLDFSVTDTSAANAIATFHEEEKKAEVVENKVTAQLATVKTPTTTSSKRVSTASSEPCHDAKNYSYDNISFCNRTIALSQASVSGKQFGDSGNGAKYVNYKYFYAHNYANLFGSIRIGDTFSVKIGSHIKYYKVTHLAYNNISTPDANIIAKKGQLYTFSGTNVRLQTCTGKKDAQGLPYLYIYEAVEL